VTLLDVHLSCRDIVQMFVCAVHVIVLHPCSQSVHREREREREREMPLPVSGRTNFVSWELACLFNVHTYMPYMAST